MGQFGNGNERKARSSGPAVQQKWEFIDVDLTAIQVSDLEALIDSGDLTTAMVLDLADAGVDVRIQEDSWGGGMKCMLIDKHLSEDGTVWVLTGRGGSAGAAILAALYRHFIMASEDWTVLITRKQEVPRFS